MVVFPNAKINLGLDIIAKRPDGYHNIESCFYPIPLTDALEVIESNKLSFTSSGISIPGNTEDNLCLKAYTLLKERYDLPPVAIHLHKHIPIGAGLGGGSADGAFMLKLLNEKFSLHIDNQELEKLVGSCKKTVMHATCGTSYLGSSSSLRTGSSVSAVAYTINRGFFDALE